MNESIKPRSWENLWGESDSRSKWSIPDEGVVALVPRLKHENVLRVLDLGCGIGRHVILLAEKGFETYAIDPSRAGIDACTGRLEALGLQAQVTRGEMGRLPYDDAFFDFVLSWNVIYHGTRKDMIAALREINRVLRRGGLLYLTLISTKSTWYGKGKKIEPGTYDIPGKEDGRHLHHFSDEPDARNLLSGWNIEALDDTEQTFLGKLHPGSYHWNILARK
jgi:SAM-dependent methyltransferase